MGIITHRELNIKLGWYPFLVHPEIGYYITSEVKPKVQVVSFSGTHCNWVLYHIGSEILNSGSILFWYTL